jgi:hypothetical protein
MSGACGCAFLAVLNGFLVVIVDSPAVRDCLLFS